MILYFSGTGNSQLVAEVIGEITGDEVVSINKYMKEGGINTFSSDKPFVFVAPTYGWRIPKVVEKWIMENKFEGKKAYFVLTCGGGVGNAGEYAEKLCKRKDWEFMGLAGVVMPENYMAMFAVPDKEESRKIIEKAEPVMLSLGNFINKDEKFPSEKITFKDRMSSGITNSIFYSLLVSDKGYSVTDKCISRGKCSKVCPVNNIKMVEGKPKWQGHCTHCMGCIGICPVEAIEYHSRFGNSDGKPQYFIMKS